MKILHITNWYPSAPTPNAAPWIKSQIDSLPETISNKVYHLEVKKGSPQIRTGENIDGSIYLIVYIPFLIWRLVELISYHLVLWVLRKEDQKEYDLVNFHIAYPNLTHINQLKKKIELPVLINEHWSAYHFNFNVSQPAKLNRIRNIFKQGVPLAAVSEALVKDIRKFSSADFPSMIVPNVVDTSIFYFDAEIERDPSTFFMVSQWKWPKDPFSILKAWEVVFKYNSAARLRIGGYGPQWEEMKLMVKERNMLNVEFIGKLSSDQVAHEMRKATAFIHSSGYETFSVVCAEALCCGTPVIASEVGGVSEVVRERSGWLIDYPIASSQLENTIKSAVGFKPDSRAVVAYDAASRFGSRTVGSKYIHSIKDAIRISSHT